MAAPRSRRSSRTSRSQPPPEEPTVEEIDVDAPDAPAEDEYASQSLDVDEAPLNESERPSGRQAGVGSRSSRRVSASERRKEVKRSGKNSNKRSARRELSPEERAKRRAGILLVVKLLLGVTLGLGAVVAIWWFAIRVRPEVDTAQQTLKNVDLLITSGIEASIRMKSPAEANLKREEALKLIDIPELGFAKPNPNLDDPKLAGIKYAQRAAAYKERLLGELKKAVERAERDQKVEVNLSRLLSGFGRLNGEHAFDDPGLATFERGCLDFLDNPVLPGAGHNPDYVKDYSGEVLQIKTQLLKIDQEKTRRVQSITDLPVREARGKAAIHVQKDEYQEALAMVDEMQRQYETADFSGVRSYVREAARLAWESTISTAEEDFKTFTSPGTTKDTADRALKAARARMEHVIEKYGIPEYVEKAKEGLTRFKPRD